MKSIDDPDERLTAKIGLMAVSLTAAVLGVTKASLPSAVQVVPVLNSEVSRRIIIDMILEHLLGPTAAETPPWSNKLVW